VPLYVTTATVLLALLRVTVVEAPVAVKLYQASSLIVDTQLEVPSPLFPLEMVKPLLIHELLDVIDAAPEQVAP